MTMRARWDSVANPKSIKEYTVDIADTIEVGDLMWYDRRGLTSYAPGGVARSFSHTTLWTGSAAGTISRAAECFIGVAMSAYVAGDVRRKIRIAGAGVFGYPLTNTATFDIGDLILPSKNPAGNVLFAQEVAKGTLGPDPQDFTALSREQAIGKAHRFYGPAVTGVVEFQIKAIHETGASTRQFLTS